MASHQKSKACVDKAKEITQAEKSNIKNYFAPVAPRAKPSRTVATPALPKPSPLLARTAQLQPAASTSQTHIPSISHPKPSLEIPSAHPISATIQALTRIRQLAQRLPDSVPIADVGDPLSVGAEGEDYVKANALTDDTSEDYENHLTHILHIFWGDDEPKTRSKIRRGPLGISGFCRVLEYFIECRSASEELILARLPRIEAAVKHL
jgi:hypothetical protein